MVPAWALSYRLFSIDADRYFSVFRMRSVIPLQENRGDYRDRYHDHQNLQLSELVNFHVILRERVRAVGEPHARVARQLKVKAPAPMTSKLDGTGTMLTLVRQAPPVMVKGKVVGGNPKQGASFSRPRS